MSFKKFTCKRERNRSEVEGAEGEDFLGIGTMLEVFHSSGKVPDIIEELKIIVRGSDIERAVFFSMVTEIPSGPEEVREGN